MAHRQFRDNAGRLWDVWSVTPEFADRRVRSVAVANDRRRRSEYRVRIGTRWVTGWLCFESHGEKRRLAPVPDAWDVLDDRALALLMESAASTSSRSARLLE